jgi:hypothetical protein
MTVDGLLNFLLGVAIPLFLAVLGGYLAVKDAKAPQKWRWVSAFAFLFLIALALSVYQQIRMTSGQKEADQKAQANQNRLEGDNKYTQGQLDSIHAVLTEVVQSGGGKGSEKEFTRALLAAVATAAASKPNGPVGLRGLSNAELSAKVVAMTSRIDAIEQQYEQDLRRAESVPGGEAAQAFQAANDREVQTFQPIKSDSQLLYEEMLARLPSDVTRVSGQPTMADTGARVTQYVLKRGSLAGAHPLRSVSSYMKKLALLLPQPQPTHHKERGTGESLTHGPDPAPKAQ